MGLIGDLLNGIKPYTLVIVDHEGRLVKVLGSFDSLRGCKDKAAFNMPNSFLGHKFKVITSKGDVAFKP